MSVTIDALKELKVLSEQAERACQELQENRQSLARMRSQFLKAAASLGVSDIEANRFHAELMTVVEGEYADGFKLRCERSDAYLRTKFANGIVARAPIDRRQPAPRRTSEPTISEGWLRVQL